jgi:hypothetical protein
MQSSDQQFMLSLSNPSMNLDVKYICFTEKRFKFKSLYFERLENIILLMSIGCFHYIFYGNLKLGGNCGQEYLV